MRPHQVNELDNFIAGWYLDDTSICDELIEYHANCPDKGPGMVFHGVDKEKKDSTDAILDAVTVDKFVKHLQLVSNAYMEKYPWCDSYAPWGIMSRVLVQHYAPGGGYHAWHCERGDVGMPQVSRHLVFITYLNDVTDGGETEFFHQKLKIKPEKGLTVIFPVDWTFTHKGNTSATQDKYITTGWFNFAH